MTWSTNGEKYEMVSRRDIKDIPGGWYGPRACHEGHEMILLSNSDTGEKKWGGAIKGENDRQNDWQKWPQHSNHEAYKWSLYTQSYLLHKIKDSVHN